jgi:hypothetical protein
MKKRKKEKMKKQEKVNFLKSTKRKIIGQRNRKEGRRLGRNRNVRKNK